LKTGSKEKSIESQSDHTKSAIKESNEEIKLSSLKRYYSPTSGEGEHITNFIYVYIFTLFFISKLE